MQPITIDTKGLACPQPVVLTKQALEGFNHGEMTVLVDNDTARENVTRFAAEQGCTVTVIDKGGNIFELLIKKEAASQASTAAPSCPEKVVYLFDADHIGANMELGKVLMNGFLSAMQNLHNKNCTIILISKAVRLAASGSYVLEVLQDLEKKSFSILICGTCLNFFKIRENVQVGTISNALEILECMTAAGKVIKF
jgi:selenium metabolism protein YedF